MGELYRMELDDEFGEPFYEPITDAEALRTLLPEVDVGRVRFLVDRLNRTAYDDLTTGELRMLYDLLLAVLDALGGSDE